MWLTMRKYPAICAGHDRDIDLIMRPPIGFGMDRDINGARGIFLRALGDSPFLHELLAQVASRPTEPCATLVSA